MKTLRFNTTLKCDGCVAKIKTDFDKDANIQKWEVDLSSNPKVLTVETEKATHEEIENLLQKNGYKGNLID